jgi:hypothetical protein
MMSKTIRDAIDSRLSEISVSEGLKTKILNKPYKSKKNIKRPLAIAAAFIMCISLSVSVLAATNKSCNELLSIISPQMAQFLMPLNLMSVDNGIKMEVIAAANDEDTSVIYLSLQDLTENRLSENMELYFAPESYNFIEKIISYDKNTKTAMVQLILNNDIHKRYKKYIDKMVNLMISGIATDRKDYQITDTGVNLSDIINSSTGKIQYNTFKEYIGGGKSILKKVLKPDQKNIAVKDMEYGYISNIGYIDGQLHIQVKKMAGTSNDYCGFLLIDKSSNEIPSDGRYGSDFKGDDGYIYHEDVFAVKASELDKYTLGVWLTTYAYHTEGNWNSKFELKDEKSKEINCNVSLKGMNINKIFLSPLGVKITCIYDKSVSQKNRYFYRISSKKDVVLVKMNDGSILTLDKAWGWGNSSSAIRKYLSPEPIKVEDVKEVSIGGNIVEIK